jgi:hypothetical protein
MSEQKSNPSISQPNGVVEPDPRGEGCLCQQCGMRYKVDLSLSDELWTKISGGYDRLCGLCIVRAIERLDKHDWFIVQQGDSVLPELIVIGETWNRGRRHEFQDIRSAISGLAVRNHVFGHDCYFKDEVDAAIQPPEDSAIASPDSITEKAKRAAEKARRTLFDDSSTPWTNWTDEQVDSKLADIIAAEFQRRENTPED